jgi:hypothetical protein
MHTPLPSPENPDASPSLNGAASPATSPPQAEPADPPAAEVHLERRSFPRRKRMIRVELRDARDDRLPFPGWVVDRSLGGLCLEVEYAPEEGTRLSVRRSAGDYPWVEVRVQTVRQVEGAWHLGCPFVRSHSLSVLMQFG